MLLVVELNGGRLSFIYKISWTKKITYVIIYTIVFIFNTLLYSIHELVIDFSLMQCLHHLWYTSVDMQLFWISPLILYPLYKKPNYGLILIVALIFSSSALSAFVIGVRQLHSMSFSHDAKYLSSLLFRKNAIRLHYDIDLLL